MGDRQIPISHKKQRKKCVLHQFVFVVFSLSFSLLFICVREISLGRIHHTKSYAYQFFFSVARAKFLTVMKSMTNFFFIAKRIFSEETIMHVPIICI